ncbi:hypothetical protein OUZ56_009600 [Daphnia magna]|uniref:CxC3 like cysteine cluster domain-containing protein n=1 Tax=Daphnia magna TaxID=35525 RepID=A0ABR0AGF8_9CRUS|nr:hypothetical protein OUZ56_009600 [Daphnia magna]
MEFKKSRKKTIVWKEEESAPKRSRKKAPESVMSESTKTRVIKTTYIDGIKSKPSLKSNKSGNLAEAVENLSYQSISNYLEPVAGPSLSAEDPCHNAQTQDCDSELLKILQEAEAELQDNLIKKHQATQEQNLKRFGKLEWKRRRKNSDSNVILFLKKSKSKSAVEAPSVVLLDIHHLSMLFVVANVDNICVRNATWKSIAHFSRIKELIYGPTKVAVITKEGRFDLTSTQFVCSVCKESRLATNEEYMFSGYWLGSLSHNSYFIEEDLLSFWHHLRHKTPGTSERKYVETLEEISLDNDRVNIINRTLFNHSRRKFEFYQYLLEKTIFRRHGKCKICGPHPHGMHADAIRKLYRFAEASDRLGVSLYGDVRMVYDDTQLKHISKIEKKIPKAKGDDLCGSSTWKAAKGETSSKRNLDITGLEMMSCTHGTVVYSANLFKGETFKHTHLQHLKSHEMGTKFFCNDVVCKYWPFAIKVGHLFPEYQQLTKDVLYNGHWEKGGADMLGEEQEQVFSYMARLGATTKHQSKASKLLAKKRSLLYRKKLQNTLEHRDVKEEELSSILERLKKQAKLVNSKNLTNDWDEQLLQKELEGECHMLKVLHARNANFFVSVGEDYDLIDTWMLSLRYSEAIVQTKKEMGEFVRSLISLCKDLENDITNYTKIRPVTLLDYSRSVLAKTEIARILEVIDKAVHAFTDVLNLNFSEDLQIEPDDFLERVEQEEYFLEALQELTDDESDAYSEVEDGDESEKE